MLDSINHMTLKLLKSAFFCVKASIIYLLSNIVMDFITFPENLKTTSGFSILLHEVISLRGGSSCDKKNNNNR